MDGQCLCGAVSFRGDEASLWCAHCHCSLCQRAHGAPLVTWTGYQEHAVKISDSQGSLTWYASSPGAERGFCARCGSSVFFRSTRWPGELHIATANLRPPLDRAPQSHVFYASHVEWLNLDDSLPRT